MDNVTKNDLMKDLSNDLFILCLFEICLHEIDSVTSVTKWCHICKSMVWNPFEIPFLRSPSFVKVPSLLFRHCCIHVSQLTLTHKQAEQPNTPLDLAFHKHLFKSIYFFQSHITFYSRSINIFTTKTFHKRITIFTKLKESRQQKERIREKYQKK